MVIDRRTFDALVEQVYRASIREDHLAVGTRIRRRSPERQLNPLRQHEP